MVKIMYKETAKSEKSPILLTILWIVFIYVFYVVWGIVEILIEAKAPFYIKHFILFALTSIFVWKIIKRFIAEYFYTANSGEFTAVRKLGRKEKVVFTIKYKNIEAIYNNDEKEKLKNYRFSKKSDISVAYHSGKKIHIVYKFDNKLHLATLKASRKMIKLLRDNTNATEDEIK